MTTLDDVLRQEPLEKFGDIPDGCKVLYGWVLPERYTEQLRPFAAGVAAKHGSEAAYEVIAGVVYALQQYDKRLMGQ